MARPPGPEAADTGWHRHDNGAVHRDDAGCTWLGNPVPIPAPFWCYPCTRGDHVDCTGVAWQPDIECECPHA